MYSKATSGAKEQAWVNTATKTAPVIRANFLGDMNTILTLGLRQRNRPFIPVLAGGNA
jgi:hypothetical protein